MFLYLLLGCKESLIYFSNLCITNEKCNVITFIVLISAILLYAFFSSFFFLQFFLLACFHRVLFIPLFSSVPLEVTSSVSILLVFSVLVFLQDCPHFLVHKKTGQLSWEDGDGAQTKYESRSAVLPIQAWPYLSCLRFHCPPPVSSEATC